MIPPVSASAGSSAAPARPLPDEVLRRTLLHSRGPRAPAEAGASRVDLSPEGVAQSRAEVRAQAPVQAQAQAQAQAPAPAASGPEPPPPPRAEARAAPPAPNESPTPAAQEPAEAVQVPRPGLSFSKADANEDGVVTLPEEHALQARNLQQTQAAPADARPDSDYSEPIRTYRSIEATMAGI